MPILSVFEGDRVPGSGALDIPAGPVVADAMVRSPRLHPPDANLEDILALFEDDHVHMALVVGRDRRLITTIERADLPPFATDVPVTRIGRLRGRTVRPSEPLEWAKGLLVGEGRRRQAVVDANGRLVGLLCLKRDKRGFCSDEGIRRRRSEPVCAQKLWSAEREVTPPFTSIA